MSWSSRASAMRRSMSPSGSTPSSSATRRSKYSGASVPSSRPISASWTGVASRKRRARSSGSRPASAQKAAKEAKTSVVSTPPKSTSRPRRSATEGHLLGPLGELEHALAEALEVGVVGRALDRALVVALHEHDRLPQGQRAIPADVLDRAPAALLVAGDELLPGGEALLPGHARELELAQRRVVAVDPQRGQVAHVGERVADRGHLPVEYGHDPGRRLGG